MKLRCANWHGPFPSAGEYIASPGRGARKAYLLTKVTLTVGLGSGTLEVEALPLERVPPGAIIHDWNWAKRSATRRGRARF